MKVLVVILGILSAVIILCLLAFSFIYESDYRQLKEWNKDKKVKSKDDLPNKNKNRNWTDIDKSTVVTASDITDRCWDKGVGVWNYTK